EVAAFKKFQTWALHVDGFERVDKAEKLRTAIAKELTELLDEGEDSRADHDVINHIRVARNLGQVAREGGLRRRDWHHGDNLAALRLDRGGEIVTVIMPKRVVGVD